MTDVLMPPRRFLRGIAATVSVILAVAAGACDETQPSAPRPPGRHPPAIKPWLAWVPGGFPEGFRDEVRRLPGVTRTVVVAGDTRWLTETSDAQGTVVDDPPGRFAYPIDAFAVDPQEYAQFLPRDVRSRVVAALEGGRAVLSTASAKIRRLGVGGSLTFENVSIPVGAIVRDQAIGWSEMLVSREVGASLGIESDRYLLAFAQEQMTEPRFAQLLFNLLPEDAFLRLEPPGTTKYVRVASGANPPVVMKQTFGEFAAYPQEQDPASLTISPAWYEAHIETRTVPLLGEVTCHEKLFPALEGALGELRDRGLGNLIHIYSGCYAPRTVARSASAPPSQHAYGAAIDIDAPTNGYGDRTPAMDLRVVRVFERWGFLWGGNFLIPDGAHFEYGSSPEALSA